MWVHAVVFQCHRKAGGWSLDELVEDELGEIQATGGDAIAIWELGSKRPRENVVGFGWTCKQPCGGREPNDDRLRKNALQVHSLRHDVAGSPGRVNQRSHQELRGGVVGDQNLRVLPVRQTPRRPSDRLDGVHVDADVTGFRVPLRVRVGVELHSHGLGGAVVGGVVEKTKKTGVGFGLGADGYESECKPIGGVWFVGSIDVESEGGGPAGDFAGGAVPDFDGGGVEGAAQRGRRGFAVAFNFGESYPAGGWDDGVTLEDKVGLVEGFEVKGEVVWVCLGEKQQEEG